MEIGFDATECYFGPWFVTASRLLFLFALAVLVPWHWVAFHRSPAALGVRLSFLRSLLLIVVAPSIAVMAMAIHWWTTVEYPVRLTLLRGTPSEELLSIFRGQLLWFIARPSICFVLLCSLLLLIRRRLGTDKAVHRGTA